MFDDGDDVVVQHYNESHISVQIHITLFIDRQDFIFFGSYDFTDNFFFVIISATFDKELTGEREKHIFGHFFFHSSFFFGWKNYL